MLIRFLSIAFVLMVLFGCENQKIIRTDDLRVIKSVCEKANSQTLVVFDMDNVLTESTERIFQADLYPKIKNIVMEYQKQVKEMPLSEREKQKAAQWKVAVCLVDEKMPQLIRLLQERNIRVLMLTANPHGKLADINPIEDLCDFRLKNLGIDFEKSWSLPDFERDFNTDLTVYSKGKIFTLESKEIALQKFLNNIPKCKFQKIIFVDDKRKNLKKIEKLSEKLHMNFVGIEYVRVFTKPRPQTDLYFVKQRFDQFRNKKTHH